MLPRSGRHPQRRAPVGVELRARVVALVVVWPDDDQFQVREVLLERSAALELRAALGRVLGLVPDDESNGSGH